MWLTGGNGGQESEFHSQHLTVFADILQRIGTTISNIKRIGISRAVDVAELLYPLDQLLEQWRDTVPGPFKYKSYKQLTTAGDIPHRYNSQYDQYKFDWAANAWNNYRMMRISIHSTIISYIPKSATGFSSRENEKIFHGSVEILTQMTDQICYSVPFSLGTIPRRTTVEATSTSATSSASKTTWAFPGGGYLLAWPLFIAGSLESTPKDLRKWIANKLQDISLRIGLGLAQVMANDLTLLNVKA